MNDLGRTYATGPKRKQLKCPWTIKRVNKTSVHGMEYYLAVRILIEMLTYAMTGMNVKTLY